jgi:WD40 repeat protein
MNTEVWDIRTHTRAYAPLPGEATGESADGSVLATTVGSGPGAQVQLWDLATGRPHGQPLSGLDPQLLGKLFFSRDGQRAAVQSGGTVTVVNLGSGAPVGKQITGQVVRYLDDGRVAVGVGLTVQLWRPDNVAPAPFATMLDGAHTQYGQAHWLSQSRVYALPGGAVWDATTGARAGDLLGQPGPSSSTAPVSDGIVNPDGTLAAVTNGDMIELWDIRQRRRVTAFDPGQRQPSATWDPDPAKPILATTGLGGTLALWNVSAVTRPRLLARVTVSNSAPAGPFGANGFSPAARWSPDGHTIAVGYLSGPPISLVSVPDAQVQHVLGTGLINLGAAFTSDSRTVATIHGSLSGNAQVLLWDASTGHQRSRTLALPYNASNVAFVHEDQWLVTVEPAIYREEVLLGSVTQDQITSRVDVWDLATSQPVGVPINVRSDAVPIDIDRPGGSRVVSGTSFSTGTYMVWDFDPAHWASIACGIAGRNLTQAEWSQYLPGRPYQLTCPQWPPGQ